MVVLSSSSEYLAIPSLAVPYMIGKSNCSSLALSSQNKSNVILTTSSGLASFLSILFINKIGFKLYFKASFKTNLVWGIGPSAESTSKITVSTVLITRSTSDEKSACPGVSTILIL